MTAVRGAGYSSDNVQQGKFDPMNPQDAKRKQVPQLQKKPTDSPEDQAKVRSCFLFLCSTSPSPPTLLSFS
jgi:hypothetical protein